MLREYGVQRKGGLLVNAPYLTHLIPTTVLREVSMRNPPRDPSVTKNAPSHRPGVLREDDKTGRSNTTAVRDRRLATRSRRVADPARTGARRTQFAIVQHAIPGKEIVRRGKCQSAQNAYAVVRRTEPEYAPAAVPGGGYR